MNISDLINTLGQKIQDRDIKLVENRSVSDPHFTVEIEGHVLEVTFSRAQYSGALEAIRIFNRELYKSLPSDTSSYDKCLIRLDHNKCSFAQMEAARKLYDLFLGNRTNWHVQDVFASWKNVKL